LLNLLGRKGKGREEFHHCLHENLCQGRRWRDPSINTKSIEEVLEGRKEVYEGIITSIDVFDRLENLYVTEMGK
jgi:hypothetical protein